MVGKASLLPEYSYYSLSRPVSRFPGRMVRNVLATVTPGLGILLMLAAVAWVVGVSLPVVHPLLLAIGIGFVFGNLGYVTSRLRPGIETHKIWLGTGIVLLGASISLGQLADAGIVILGTVLGMTILVVVLVELVARFVFAVDDTLGSLLAAGTGICGVSAVVAVAGSIDARESYIAYAAGTVVLFDAVTVVAFPAIGDLLDLSGMAFGIWAGIHMFSTGPVVAAGFVHSDVAGQWATVTKLTRNTLIGFVAIAYAIYYTRKYRVPTAGGARVSEQDGNSMNIQQSSGLSLIWAEFPKFVIGFVALMVVASAGVFTDGQVESIEATYNWLFMLAFVGLGTEIEIATIRKSGLKPLLIVLTVLVLTSSVSLVVLVGVLG